MISKIIDYENGELPEDQVAELFQYLLDTGTIFHLQGHYQRNAERLLEQGLITRSPNHGARKRAKKRGRKAVFQTPDETPGR